MEALRDKFPQAEIVLLGQQWHADFLSGRPSPVDRVIVVPGLIGLEREATGKEIGILDEFFGRVRQEKFDLALQIYGGGRFSNPYTLRLGAKQTIGLKTPDAVPLDRWVPYVYFQSEILRYLEVVSLVGAHPVQLAPRLEATEKDIAEAKYVLPSQEKPLALFHVGAGDPRRRWPTERFAALGDQLSIQGFQVAIIGTGREKAETRTFIQQMVNPVIDLCDRLSLGGLVGLVSLCNLFISNDSGPMHIAVAAGAPVVGIYWCGNLINAAPLYRTRFRPVSSWRLDCPICGRDIIYNPCDHLVSFVADINVEEVLEAAQNLLDNL